MNSIAASCYVVHNCDSLRYSTIVVAVRMAVRTTVKTLCLTDAGPVQTGFDRPCQDNNCYCHCLIIEKLMMGNMSEQNADLLRTAGCHCTHSSCRKVQVMPPRSMQGGNMHCM